MNSRTKKRVLAISVVVFSVLLVPLAALILTGGGSASPEAKTSLAAATTAPATKTATATTPSVPATTAATGVTGAPVSTGTETDTSNPGAGQAGQGNSSSSGNQSPQPQTLGLKPGNMMFTISQGSEYHYLTSGAPIDFMMLVQLWVPVNQNEIAMINQPSSVYIEYWKTPGGIIQTIDCVFWKNDQGSAWWQAWIPPLPAGEYEGRAYAVTSENTASITNTFTIHQN